MLTVVFYNSNSGNGARAKLRSREIAATAKGNHASVIDVGFWDGTPVRCDSVEIIPGTPEWQRKRILEVYGDLVVGEQQEEVVEQQEEVVEQPKAADAETLAKKAVHKGGGRWFVMLGEERISGPHDKTEALRLAEQG